MQNTATKKTILVTGARGLHRFASVRAAWKDGHTVVALDNYFTGSRENHVAGVEYREGHTKGY